MGRATQCSARARDESRRVHSPAALVCGSGGLMHSCLLQEKPLIIIQLNYCVAMYRWRVVHLCLSTNRRRPSRPTNSATTRMCPHLSRHCLGKLRTTRCNELVRIYSKCMIFAAGRKRHVRSRLTRDFWDLSLPALPCVGPLSSPGEQLSSSERQPHLPLLLLDKPLWFACRRPC